MKLANDLKNYSDRVLCSTTRLVVFCRLKCVLTLGLLLILKLGRNADVSCMKA